MTRLTGRALSEARRRSSLLILAGLVVSWVAWGIWADELPSDLLAWAAFGSLVLALAAEIVAMHRDGRRLERQAELEADLSLLRAELRATDSAHAEVLAKLSHELRTPVHAVLGMSDLLLSGGLLGEQRRRAEVLRASAEMLQVLVDNALDLAKMDAGRLDLQEEIFAPRDLLAQTLTILAHGAEAKGLGLSHTVHFDVPEALRGDAQRLRQVWLNLAGNAIKYTRQGAVEVRLGYADGVLLCEVEDSGVGISSADMERLFRPFQRADTTVARSVGGSGLGLAICHHLVAEMGGTIGCRSRRDEVGPGCGSTFWFRVPLAEAATSEFPHPAAESSTPLAGYRVLVVDDDAIHRLVITSHLEDLGAEVVEAGGGRQALDLLARSQLDVAAALVDVQMPAMDGPETIRRLLAAWPELVEPPVVIAVTAEATAAVRARCLEAGADDLLAKPFRRADLIARLRSRLPERTAPRESVTAAAGAKETVPASLAGSETLAALWRRSRRTGRDEVSYAIDGLRDAGARSLVDLRRAVAEGRADDAATCAHGLAGVAAVLGCRELEMLCRDFALDAEPEQAGAIERELDAAVGHLRSLWPVGQD